MSVEVNVYGLRCGAQEGGLSCVYCYEGPVRDASENKPPPTIDHAAIQRALLQVAKPGGKESFALFGGEPLLAPLEDLERLWAFGLEKYGRNGVQTSGRPITEAHMEMFQRYKVHVGFSIDGPEELNNARWAGSPALTRAATDHSNAMLERCLTTGISAGLICTLTKRNAAAERLPRLVDWLAKLDDLGMKSMIVHVLEHDGPTRYISLSDDENFEAMMALHRAEVSRFKTLRIDTFRDIVALLRGEDVWEYSDKSVGGVSCVWGGCDPLNTPAVQGIEPDGTRSLCHRVHKAGTSWQPVSRGPLARQLALRATPQEEGGCQGCRFVVACKGQCPGTAIGGDWRKRSRDCALWMRLFEYFETRLADIGEKPVTLRPDRDKIEEVMADAWAQGDPIRIKTALKIAGTRAKAVAGRDGWWHEDHHDSSSAFTSRLVGAAGEKVR